MDALFEKLDRLSSPIGTLLDKVLARLAPQTTAAATCNLTYRCNSSPGFCGARCGSGPIAQYIYYQFYSSNLANCNLDVGCFKNVGCIC